MSSDVSSVRSPHSSIPDDVVIGDAASSDDGRSRRRIKSSWDLFSISPSEYRVQCLRISRDNLKMFASSVGKLEQLDRYFRLLSKRRVSCSRESMRWLATKRAQDAGYHVVWIRPSEFSSRGVVLALHKDNTDVAIVTSKKKGESNTEDARRHSSRSSIPREHRRAYKMRFLSASVSITPVSERQLPSSSINIRYSEFSLVGRADVVHSSFLVDLKGDPKRRMNLKCRTYNAALGLRQVLLARLTASRASISRSAGSRSDLRNMLSS